MTFDIFHAHCQAKPGVEETFPFDEVTLVLKVMGKMFALTGLDREEFSLNLKCDPDWAIELREQYPDIQEGYHMSKKHWNTILAEGDVPDDLLFKMIDHSYDLVVQGLPKKLKLELEELRNER
jgi:predicted DNA-binding protein (MmcQ/YjbR family)